MNQWGESDYFGVVGFKLILTYFLSSERADQLLLRIFLFLFLLLPSIFFGVLAWYRHFSLLCWDILVWCSWLVIIAFCRYC
jgi:hypothetical protein